MPCPVQYRHTAGSGKLALPAYAPADSRRQDQGLWTGPERAWLASLELAAATPQGIVEDCCGLLDALATPIVRLEREPTPEKAITGGALAFCMSLQ
jgi:hypothetical protein